MLLVAAWLGYRRARGPQAAQASVSRFRVASSLKAFGVPLNLPSAGQLCICFCNMYPIYLGDHY